MSHEKVVIKIPKGLEFSSLKLRRDPVTLDISFNWEPIVAICEASGLDVSQFRDSHEDNVSGLIVAWYQQHVAVGGEPDEVQEQILAEVFAEDHFGQANVQSAPASKQ